MLTNNLTVNNNTLYIGNVSAVELAKEYGTPLYVMDENLIRENMRAFKKSFDEYYDGNGLVCYASKAFSCLEIYRIAKEEGVGTDVVSGGELYTALKAGFDPKNVVFHGNNKTIEELEYAVSVNVGRIVVDNLTELENLNGIAQKANKIVDIQFRIKPGIDAHTHDFVKTGQIDSKFGFALETGEAFEAVKKSLEYNNINLKGLHCHIGSQIMDTEPFTHAVEVMFTLIEKIKSELNYEIDELNLGGGFGIKYLENDDFIPYNEYIRECSVVVKKIAKEKNLKVPFIMIEPGRSIAAPAGITLYTVGAVKNIPDIRKYVSIDGSMCDNPRYALYQSTYEALCANKAAEEKNDIITLAGRCCESGDLIGKDMPLQTVDAGDIIAVLATGAYNYSMSLNYNRLPRPAVIFVKDGKSRVVIKRETYEDIIRNDV
ncbi:MAG: diaminopimelate decarboxylase [Oscillospiraceae bacterium]|jgi:diaminopimelate decarboxylase|nr:diaminopimelate decarboxylase [Oscillospiraceae bacterium]